MKNNLSIALIALVASTLVLMAIYQGWQSVLGFVSALVFSGFVLWLNPSREVEIKRTDFEQLKLQCDALKAEVVGLKVQLGFQRGR